MTILVRGARVLVVAMAVILTGGLMGCGSNSETETAATVQVINLSPDSRAVSLWRERERASNLDGNGNVTLSYPNASRVVRVRAGRAVYSLMPGPDYSNDFYFQEERQLTIGSRYAIRLLGALRPVGEEQALTSTFLIEEDVVPAGRVGLRFTHAGLAMPGVDVTAEVTAPPAPAAARQTEPTILASNLHFPSTTSETEQGFNRVTGLVAVEPGTITVIARRAGDTAILAETSLTATAGAVINLALTGNAANVAIVNW